MSDTRPGYAHNSDCHFRSIGIKEFVQLLHARAPRSGTNDE